MKTEIKGDQIVKTLSFTLIVLALLCLLAGALQAQETDSSKIRPPVPVELPPLKSFLVTGVHDTLWLSDSPTCLELTKIFAAPGQGHLDPFSALQAVIGKGDSAVPALDSLLFGDPLAGIFTRKSATSGRAGSGEAVAEVSDTVRPNKLYAVMALEAIASKASYPVLIRSAQRHPDRSVRGLALNALASTFHEADRLTRFLPDKELLHVLLLNVDDTTGVPYLEKSFGQIARQGLIQWLGEDLGEAQGKARRLQTASGADRGSLADYREAWWNAVAAKITWDGESRRFRLR